MRAIVIEKGRPSYSKRAKPEGDGVLVRIASASICGSDLHMMQMGILEGRTPGHEFAGTTEDGTAVAVEPLIGCGHCHYCDEGYVAHCTDNVDFIGVGSDGGMAEWIRVPRHCLVPLPTGLPLWQASLVEPLAVALHCLNQADVRDNERILIIGGGSIGLATAAALHARGQRFTLSARHAHQQSAAQALGATLAGRDDAPFDVVIDAVGTSESLTAAACSVRPLGRIGLVGTPWSPASLPMEVCMKEVTLVPSATYRCSAPRRPFEEAAQHLHQSPHIAEQLITHRFPLEAAQEAFDTAADRSGGAIKVCFDVTRD